jgi:hypothetical protein
VQDRRVATPCHPLHPRVVGALPMPAATPQAHPPLLEPAPQCVQGSLRHQEVRALEVRVQAQVRHVEMSHHTPLAPAMLTAVRRVSPCGRSRVLALCSVSCVYLHT